MSSAKVTSAIGLKTYGEHLEEVLLGHGETLELLLVLDDALGEGLEGGVVGGNDLAARRESEGGQQCPPKSLEMVSTHRSPFMPIS